MALPRTKQRIIDAVCARPGIDAETLRGIIWADDPSGGPEDRKVLHVHVNQLNRLLRKHGLRVRGHPTDGYRVFEQGDNNMKKDDVVSRNAALVDAIRADVERIGKVRNAAPKMLQSLKEISRLTWMANKTHDQLAQDMRRACEHARDAIAAAEGGRDE